jgi:hypothetical protein
MNHNGLLVRHWTCPQLDEVIYPAGQILVAEVQEKVVYKNIKAVVRIAGPERTRQIRFSAMLKTYGLRLTYMSKDKESVLGELEVLTGYNSTSAYSSWKIIKKYRSLHLADIEGVLEDESFPDPKTYNLLLKKTVRNYVRDHMRNIYPTVVKSDGIVELIEEAADR